MKKNKINGRKNKMKKIMISLIIISLFLITSNSIGEIAEQKAKGYIGQNVAIVLDCYIRPYLIYGMPIDVTFYEGEWYLILKTNYREEAEMFIKLKNIHSIRKRYENE